MHHLLGPERAMARLQELQARIDALSPSPPELLPTGPNSFHSTLSGVLPADPSQFKVQPSAGPLGGMADAAAVKHGLDPKVFRALVGVESSWNPDAKSRVGATGLCQLMPSTAAALGVTDPTDPAQSLDGGAKYLKQMLEEFGGDYSKALAAYNAGPGAVRHAGGIPPYQETLSYVRKILGAAGGDS